MRRAIIFILIIFNFQSLSIADDFRKFKIEGISLGDSALKFFPADTLLKNIRKDQYQGSDGKFYDTQIYDDQNFVKYNEISLGFKKGDKKYIIHSIAGIIYFGRDSENCNAVSKTIAKEFESLYPDHSKDTFVNEKHHQDPSGKSLVNGTLLILRSGSSIEVSCYAWSDQMKREDYVIVSINSKEYEDWLFDYFN